MEGMDVRRLGLIFAVQAEIEGMKALNEYRLSRDETIAYDEESFVSKAEELRNLSHCHDEQL